MSRSIFIIGALFFVFGFVTWLNGALIPYFKIVCELSNFESLLVAFCFYISYFVMALPSSWILNKTGFKNGMMIGLWVMALGMLLFIPAALSRNYAIFLGGLFVIGSGLAVLQTAANPYVTVLGDPESAAQRISIMGISNKIAGVLSPLLLGFIVFANAGELTSMLPSMTEQDKAVILNDLATKIIPPYVGMALVLTVLGLAIWKINLPAINLNALQNSENETGENRTSVLAYPNLVLGVVALFLYVGVEVIAGDTIISYAMSQGIALDTAKTFTSYTLAAMIIGYILGIYTIPKYIKQENALAVSALLGMIFSLVTVFSEGYISVFFIAALGLANAVMWPAIWPLSIKNLGKHTGTGSSLLIMAIAGGALLPLVYGKLADAFSSREAYWLMLPCYGYILYFALKGNKIEKWQ